MPSMSSPRRVVPLVTAALFMALVWVSNGFFGYGIFIDALYYLSCARRLGAGYVDHPPLSIWWLRALIALGDPLPWLRLWPALAGGAVIALATRLCGRLGGSTRAMIVTAIATAGRPCCS